MRKISTFWISIQILDIMYIPVKVTEAHAQISYVICLHSLHTSDIGHLESKLQFLHELVNG